MKISAIFTEKLKQNFPSILFSTFTLILLCGFIISAKEEYSEDEKRVLEKYPEFSLSSLANGSYGKNFEKYLSDHFASRKFFIGLNSYYDLISGRNGSNGVYKGKDDYLIVKPMNINLDLLKKNISKINDLNQKSTANYYFIPVPSAGYIMNDKLPYNHLSYRDGEILKEVRSSLNSDICYIDVENVLNNRMETNVFYKTDHHWNTYGAYIAYLEYCNYANISPVKDNDIEKQNYYGFYGTSYSKSGLWFSTPDFIDIWRGPSSDKVDVFIDDGNNKTKTGNSIFFTEHLDSKDKYPVFVDGNHSFVKIYNENLEDGNLLIIKDSFAHSMVPFLIENYRNIYMIDMRYYKSSVSDIIRDNKINNVLIIYGIDNLSNDSNISWIR